MDSVEVGALKAPDSSLTETDLDLCKSTSGTRNWPRTPLPVDEEINERVILYDGDIELLSAEAIVNPTNESMTQLKYVSQIAGPELEEFIKRKVRSCPTGDVRLTPGFRSNYKQIIHAVPPKYQPKYKTAAETALFHTYFRILETMIVKKIRTVVMPILATSKCSLPLEDNCQLQLRIIRRMLEKKRHEFDRIVVHVKDLESHATTFFSHFPRTSLDEEIACYHLPISLGGPNGEPVIPEREIRIKSKPADPNDNSIDLTSGLDLSTVVGNTAFSKMREDLEAQAALGGGKRSLGFLSPAKSAGLRSNQLVARRKAVITGCNLF